MSYAIYCDDEDIPDHIISHEGGNPGNVNGDGEVNIVNINGLI